MTHSTRDSLLAVEAATAIVVTYNSADVIATCLEALVRSGIRDVVVVDNASRDSTREIVRGLALEGVRLVRSGTNVGFGAGVNLGAGVAPRGSGDLLLVNPDCVVTPAVVEALLTWVREPGIGLAAPAMVYGDGRRGISGGARPSLVKEILASTGLDDLIPDRARAVLLRRLASSRRAGSLTGYAATLSARGLVDCAWVCGFCMAVRRETWSTVGGFDERFFLYFEDVDLSLRAGRSGWRVVCDTDREALHYESSSTGPAGKGPHYRRGAATYFAVHGRRTERFLARRLLGEMP